MHIDIIGRPPADLARRKKRLLRIVSLLLGLVLCAVLLAIVRVVLDTGQDAILENVAIALFVGAGFAFVYFAEKLQDLKSLTVEQQSKVEEFCRRYPEVDAYCDRVAASQRNLIAAEYEAITAHVDKIEGKTSR